jgi:1-phosphofructokinase
MSVITVTLAPSIDRTYHIAHLNPGEVHRSTQVTEELAGKGVNVSHALNRAGIETTALVPVPPHEHSRWESRPWVHAVEVDVSPRVSITLLEPDGRTTKINQSAPALGETDWLAVSEALATVCSRQSVTWMGICGALPALTTGEPVDLEGLVDRATTPSARIVLDTSGPALAVWARRGWPDVIKPNADELAECVGRAVSTLGEVVEAAQEVQSWGVHEVLVSLGRDGMIGVSPTATVFAQAEPVTVVNTIGAGDASLAGFLAHRVTSPTDFAGAVGNAVAWGSLKVTQAGSQLQSVDNPPRVFVSEAFDPRQVLSEPGRV